MSFRAQEGTINFGANTGSVTEVRAQAAFGRRVKVNSEGRPIAWAMVNGFSARFTGDDRNFKQLIVDLQVLPMKQLLPQVVEVEGTLGLRDNSGRYDDGFAGHIQFVVLADLEDG
jgi:hypothetical protein